MGNNSAASVVVQMRNTFRSVYFCLVVGIGGGVPTICENIPIRLGDVVVSTPTGNHSGAIQYDHGKAKSGGFERTGCLQSPPTVLLNAANKLAVCRDTTEEGDPLAKNLERIDISKGDLQKYKFPGREKDHLYSPFCLHADASKSCVECGCDASQRISRNDDNKRVQDEARLVVHHGTIASGELVLKDGYLRDILAKQHNILCFEMEAAGALNDCPCLVIRGISDYCDSHKNNMWHGFAAAAAASYARQLFFYMPLYEVKMKAKLSNADLQMAHKEAKRTAILNWLSLTDFTSQQAQLNSSRHSKTGEWLLRSTEFRRWLETTKQILFCTGKPGAGKTVMTSMVIDDLQRKFQGRSDIGIAYIYCNFEQHDEQRTDRLLAGLLKQLVQRIPVTPQCVEDLYHDSKEHKQNGPLAQELVNPIVTAISSFKKTFIILDALDECQSSSNSMLLKALFDIHHQTAANIFVTSRRVSHIERAFVDCVSIDIRARPEDLTEYIDARLEELQEFVQDRPDLQNSVRDTIINAADGVFLFARIQMDQLRDCLTPNSLKSSLQGIPSGPGAYADMYDKTLKIVEDQSEIKRNLAFNVLSWMFYSKRTLTTLELLTAVAIEIGVPHLNQENIRGACPSDEAYNQRLVENPFFDYAAWYWADHVRENSLQEDEVVTRLVLQQENMAAVAQAKMSRILRSYQPGYSQKFLGSMKVGHVIARFGLDITLKRLLESGMHPDVKDKWGRTALYHAAIEGHGDVIEMLLQNKANVNAQGGPHGNALRAASHNGHYEVVKILLDHKADVNLPAADSITALRAAIVMDRQDVVRLLLERGANVNPREPGIDTPLTTSINHDRRDISKTLLDNGANPNGVDGTKLDPPLVIASRMHRLHIVKLLLEAGAAIDKTSGRGITPLAAAAGKGHFAVVKVLLDRRPKVDMLVGDTKTTVLLMVSGLGFVKHAETLLDAGASVNLPAGTTEKTPLIAAAEAGRIEVVKLLIDRRADVNAQDMSSMSALHHAATKGHIEIVKVLVQAGSSISNTDRIGRDAIMCASGHARGHSRTHFPTTVQYLLDHRGDCSKEKQLYTASWLNRADLVASLLGQGVDVNARGGFYGSPLYAAAFQGHRKTVDVLLAHKADVNRRGENMGTPLLIATEFGFLDLVKSSSAPARTSTQLIAWGGQHFTSRLHMLPTWNFGTF
ncbi:unnamed protein product [Aureobasidium mustum]|uniref:Nephrocystin 3-like N-terminal domain-containing protein n=1 Tax=Aureobasidium mustum TaxID=2773714 RepID=A0A9N8K3I8_9PEZI|nr:unnamed protein product [Aureobasidium mustum]